jgi:hypothetical protein
VVFVVDMSGAGAGAESKREERRRRRDEARHHDDVELAVKKQDSQEVFMAAVKAREKYLGAVVPATGKAWESDDEDATVDPDDLVNASIDLRSSGKRVPKSKPVTDLKPDTIYKTSALGRSMAESDSSSVIGQILVYFGSGASINTATDAFYLSVSVIDWADTENAFYIERLHTSRTHWVGAKNTHTIVCDLISCGALVKSR